MKNRLKTSNQAGRVIKAFLSSGKSSQRVVENRRKQQENGCKQNNTLWRMPVHLFFCTHDSHSPTKVHRAPSHDLKDAPTPRPKPLVHCPANKSTPHSQRLHKTAPLPQTKPLVHHPATTCIHHHGRWCIARLLKRSNPHGRGQWCIARP